MEARLQAQVRALSREVGAIKEELNREVKRRERLAVRAKECEELLEAAQSKTKSLVYVNSKLEQELSALKDRAQSSNAKSRSGLETLRGRLGEVEKSVAARAVEAQRQLQRVRSMLQELAGATMPLAVMAAASKPQQPQPQRRTWLQGPTQPARLAPAQPRPPGPAELQQRFSQVLAGLNQLSEAITGRAALGDCDTQCGAGAGAPLLLTAPDGSTRAVHWRADEPAAAQCSGPPALDTEKEQLRNQVQQLQAELTAARVSSRDNVGGSRLQAAMQQLEAVVPQYRAAASALQGQVTVLRKKLGEAVRDRGQLQEEVAHWQARAQQLEAMFTGATAKAHAKEAQVLALSTQAQSQSDRLSGDVEALRQRCADLGARLRGAQQELGRLQAAVAERDRLINTQAGTIRQLESTIADQQADIRSALDLVTSRSGAAGDLGGTLGDALLQPSTEWDAADGHLLAGLGAAGGCSGSPLLGMGDWAPGALGSGPALGLELLPDPLAEPDACGWRIPSAGPAPAMSGAGGCTDSGGFGAVSISPRAPHPQCSPAVSSMAPQPVKRPQQEQQEQQRSPGPQEQQSRPKSAGRGATSIEAEIAGLEDALRQALTDLNV